MKEITFIIPCAGKGSRLGIPFPKEMLPIDKEMTLIDKCFENLKQFKDICQIVIIISKEKEELVKYLSKYSDEFNIYFVYQKTYYKELIGAIKSAEDFFLEKNVIILPDILINDENLEMKLHHYINILNYQDYSFLITHETDKNILSKVGNVIVFNNKIIDAIDKPDIYTINQLDLSHYWVSIAFKKDSDFFNFFNDLQKNKTMIELNRSINYDYSEIDFALDLGVWQNIEKFYKIKR